MKKLEVKNAVLRKLKDFKDRLRDRKMMSITLTVIAIFAVIGGVFYKTTMDFNQKVENQYRRAFYDMTDSVNNIDVAMSKAVLTRDPKQLIRVSYEIMMNSENAKANLSQLPISDVNLENTQKYLAQVGDFTGMVLNKAIDGQNITSQEADTFVQLSAYATKLSDSLNNLENQLYSANTRFGFIKKMSQQTNVEAQKDTTGFSSIQQGFENYPTLIYDGPFSEHLNQLESKFLKDRAEITTEQGAGIIKNFVGADNITEVSYQGETNANIVSFSYKLTTKNKNTITADVSKKGGEVIWFLSTKDVKGDNLSFEDGVKKANEFLASKGYNNFKESYYEKANGAITINYAYNQDGVIMYPDLIKVKVATDDGTIIGFEAKAYLMNHQIRQIPATLVSENIARQKISPSLQIDQVAKAYIPLLGGGEVFCYEIKGKLNQKEYLVYVNAQKGNVEKILLLLISENGVLTM